MTLNAIQSYVKGLLNGITLPFPQDPTLTAYIAPPIPGDEVAPLCYIWGSVVKEKRQTAPRAQPGNLSSGGFKLRSYNLDLWLYAAEASDDPSIDSLFPAVIDAVCRVLRNTQMQIQITDAATGETSTVQAIGEDFQIDYAPVRTLDDQRMSQYMARIIVDITERIQA